MEPHIETLRGSYSSRNPSRGAARSLEDSDGVLRGTTGSIGSPAIVGLDPAMSYSERFGS